MKQAFVALGSNLDDPESKVTEALACLAQESGMTLISHSPMYRTAPVGYLDQPEFINAVAEVATDLTPHELLAALMSIETRMGRVRTFRNAPRTLDLDLLWYQDVLLNSEELTLPHPRMQERAFVLVPLNDIAPHLEIGVYGKVCDLVTRLDKEGIQRM